MSYVLKIDEFVLLASSIPVIDVRSPFEYQKGHIPGSFNLPLLNDEERHLTGLSYAKHGKSEAVRGALEMVGPKMIHLVDEAHKIAPEGHLAVYCFRGGMRSKSMAWLLEISGFNISILEGGYKSWRAYALKELANPKPLMVITGHTGCGKTEILHTLATMGEQVIDLEGLASHRGSVFGAIGLPNQPSSEHFSNLLAMQWLSLDDSKPTYIESESVRIGNVQIDQGFFAHIENAPAICIQSPRKERINRILNEYATNNKDLLINAFQHICRRLGDKNTRDAILAVQENRLHDAVEIALNYYDSFYKKQQDLRNKDQLMTFDTAGLNQDVIASKIIELTNQFYGNNKTYTI